MQDRRQRILQELEEKGRVRVTELSQQLGCSEMTIRSDIKALQAEGRLHRVHGGAVRLEHDAMPITEIPKYAAESLQRNTESKRKIAARAYQYIQADDTIILDDASTSYYLAEYIKLHPQKHLVVVTNSLPIGNELAGLDHVSLYMIGGYVGGRLAATMGEAAVESIQSFRVDKAFIGVHSINFDVGLTSVATPQMQVKHAILRAAKQIYVLADSSKFGGGYLSVICPINQVDAIITDSGILPEDRHKAEELDVNLIISP